MELIKDLVEGIRDGTIDPKKAVEKYETPAVHLSEIPIDNLKVNVLETGFPTLDEYMVLKRGRGELIILGARPSVGKSAFLFQIATHVARNDNVYIASLEMDKESIKARQLAGITGQGLQRIFKGEVKRGILEQGNKELSKLNMYIDDRSGLDIKTLSSSISDFHKRKPLSLVVIDYLQLVKSGNRQSRNEEVGDVSNELKHLSKKLNCAVLVASQLNRKCLDRGAAQLAKGREPDFRPEMGDLRESGNIEQDADGILFLSRHEVFAHGYRTGTADIRIAKQRNGPTGDEVFKWLGSSTRFLDPKTEGGL